MKLVALAVLATAAAATPAAADERAMFVNVGGTVGIGEPDGENAWGESPEPEGVLMGRLFASWELPPVPYKEPRGYKWRGAVVPEVMIGRIRIADHRTGNSDDNSATFVAVGGRLEAGLSQRKMGLFQTSVRGALYAAGRFGLLDDELRTPIIEAVVGEYIYLGETARIGVEAGLTTLLVEERETFDAIRANARGPWADQTGTYYAGVFSVYLGVKL